MSLIADLRFGASLLLHEDDRRFARRWWTSRARAAYPLETAIPWIVFAAIDALDAMSLDGARVFEYGSGGSTLYWTRRSASKVVSIEHDSAWYRQMKDRLPASVDLRLVEPERDPRATADDPADPDAYTSEDDRSRGFRFRAYAAQIDTFDDASFDVVLVDGRSRPACIRHAAPKVKAGGLLIVDNADRPYYFARTAADLQPFERRLFEGPAPSVPVRTATAFFRRRQR